MNYKDETIIRALKFGRVPASGTLRLAVGRDLEIAEFKRTLDYVAGGYSEIRLLRGDYGSGKTFMCSVIRELAFEKEFAVSVVNLNREIPFGRRELVVSEILLGLRQPNSPSAPALSYYLERWANLFDLSDLSPINKLLHEAIAKISSIDPSIAGGLRAWLSAYADGNDVLMHAAEAWMRGDSIDQESRRSLKVVGKITAESAFRRLRSISALLFQAGCMGVAVLIDEAESIMRLNGPQRNAAWTSIREMIDTCETDFPKTFFIFAGTQPLFEDPYRGISEYPALWDRIRPQQSSSDRDLRQPIIRLEELDETSLLQVAQRVRDIHSAAYGWDAKSQVLDANLVTYIKTAASKFGNIKSKPRAFLKGLVDYLDGTQQGIPVDLGSIIESAVKIETEQAPLEDDLVLAGT